MKRILSLTLSLVMAVTLMMSNTANAAATESVELTGDQLASRSALYFTSASYSVGEASDDYIGKVTFGAKINAQDKGFALYIKDDAYAALHSSLSDVFVSRIEYTFAADADITLKPYMSTNEYLTKQMRNPDSNFTKDDYALLSAHGDTFTVEEGSDYTFVAKLNAYNKYNGTASGAAENFVDAWGSNYNYLYLYPQTTDCTTLYIKSVKVYYYTVAGEMVKGAGLRVGVHNGVRFFTTIDKDLVEEASERGYTVTMGTLIAPYDTLGGEELTFDSPKYANLTVSGYFNNNDDGVIAASLTNIKEANIARDFVGRGYVKIQKGDQTIIYYADMNDNVRSLKTIAAAVCEDENFFPLLSDSQKVQVTAWANA